MVMSSLAAPAGVSHMKEQATVLLLQVHLPNLLVFTHVAEERGPSALRWAPSTVGGKPGFCAAPHAAPKLQLPVRPSPAAAAPG